MVMLVYQRVLGRAAGFHVLPPAEANENNQIVPKHPGTLINWWQAGGLNLGKFGQVLAISAMEHRSTRFQLQNPG